MRTLTVLRSTVWVLSCIIFTHIAFYSSYSYAKTQEDIKEISFIIQEKALVLPSAESMDNFQKNTQRDQNESDSSHIRNFLTSFDQYAEYITKEELINRQYRHDLFDSGIGMDLIEDQSGYLICIPYPNSFAEKSGIRYGDRLLAVDDLLVGNDIDTASVLIRGEESSAIRIKIMRDYGEIGIKEKENYENQMYKVPDPEDILPDGSLASQQNRKKDTGEEYEFYVPRGHLPPPPSVVKVDSIHGLPCFRIYRFDKDTAKSMYTLLGQERSLTEMVIDLRGATGGDIKAAKDALSLFLPENAIFYKTEDPFGRVEIFRNKEHGVYSHTFVHILQDALTASAAEAFILSMLERKNSVNIGFVSGGKARIQEFFPLKSGNFLKLTTKRLLYFADQNDWQNVGILPLIQTYYPDSAEDGVFVGFQ